MANQRKAVSEFTRVLGIDFGSQRVGLSVSDPLGIIAQPKGTLIYGARFWDELKDVVKSENVSLVVVGMPLNLKGQKGQKAEEVSAFVDRLKHETHLEVVTWDERFTTSIAKKTLIDMGTKKKDRRTNKQQIDAMAAAVILQSFLDSTKKSLCC